MIDGERLSDELEDVGLGIWVGAGAIEGWSDVLAFRLWFADVCWGWIGGGKFAAAIIIPSSKSSCPHAFAPGILDNTLDKSTPVKALMAGGSWPTSLVTSPVMWSEPLIRTISSVLANGAATSAAI